LDAQGSPESSLGVVSGGSNSRCCDFLDFRVPVIKTFGLYTDLRSEGDSASKRRNALLIRAAAQRIPVASRKPPRRWRDRRETRREYRDESREKRDDRREKRCQKRAKCKREARKKGETKRAERLGKVGTTISN